jgi:hypothetical protein
MGKKEDMEVCNDWINILRMCYLSTIMNIVLKLAKAIDIPWIGVLSPLWIPFAIFEAVFIAIDVYVLLERAIWAVREKRRRK